MRDFHQSRYFDGFRLGHDPPDINAVKHIPEAIPELIYDDYSQAAYDNDNYSQLTPDYDDYS